MIMKGKNSIDHNELNLSYFDTFSKKLANIKGGCINCLVFLFLDKFSSRDFSFLLELKKKWDQLIRLCSLFRNRLSVSRQIEREMQKVSYFFVLFELTKKFDQLFRNRMSLSKDL
jgi:hypothetical protein